MSGYVCGPCEGANPVTTLLTNLSTGQTEFSCAGDLPLLLIGTLAGWLEVDPQRLYDAIQRFADREAKAAAKAAAAPEPPAGSMDEDPQTGDMRPTDPETGEFLPADHDSALSSGAEPENTP